MLKKLGVLVMAIIALSSCSISHPTEDDIAAQKRICDLNQEDVKIVRNPLFWTYHVVCGHRKDEVKYCIDSYVESVKKKYNNPDHVSNLNEDGYSTVVRTCKETFGK